MTPHRYSSAMDFLHTASPLLLAAEAENNVMLGVVGRLAHSNAELPADVYLATVNDDGQPVAAAMMTPPFRLVLTDTNDTALCLIADDLQARSLRPPGVLGAAATARKFAELWSQQIGMPFRPGRNERIYRLNVVAFAGDASGGMRVTGFDDFEFLVDWWQGFYRDAAPEVDTSRIQASVETMIAEGGMVVWEDGGTPVAMAAAVGPTPNGIRISGVYTPPEFRRRGYATALVAQLSQRLLGSGHQFCTLFTDRANPTSNSIYQKIGYRMVCDVDEYDF